VYEIELNQPKGGREAGREYIGSELEAIGMFFCRHREFYRYYRSGERHFDQYYFLRGTQGMQSSVGFCFECGAEFSTGGDHILAQILAYDMLEAWLLEQLDRLEEENNAAQQAKTGLVWTQSKTDLVEIALPLYLMCAFNGGKITQVEYRRRIENAFNIDLSNFSRILHDLKTRNNPTQFLDKLKKILVEYLDRDDELFKNEK